MLIASAVGLSLFLTFLFFTARDIEQHRAAKLAELFSMAEVIAFNASAVVEFKDNKGADPSCTPAACSTCAPTATCILAIPATTFMPLMPQDAWPMPCHTATTKVCRWTVPIMMR